MKILKEVVMIGNGAAVYVPKEYRGREVLITLPEGIDEIQRRVLRQIIEWMPNIIGVYLCGSYARQEEDIHSDIDILVVTQERNEQIKSALKEFDARIVPLKDLWRTMKNYPLFLLPMILEAKTFLNPSLLEDLKNAPVNFKKFKWHFDEIGRIINISKSFLKRDTNAEVSAAVLASIIMRIRVCYLISGIINNIPYTSRGFKEIYTKNGFEESEVERWFSLHRELRTKQETSLLVQKKEIQELLIFLKKYLQEVQIEARKKAQKRN